MKVYYFNDENKPVTIYLYNLHGKGTILSPASGAAFEIEDNDSIPYIKRWSTDIILISTLTPKVYKFLKKDNIVIYTKDDKKND